MRVSALSYESGLVIGGNLDQSNQIGRRKFELSRSMKATAANADLPALYDEHYRGLIKLASMYVDDVQSAEEVVQDCFVKLLAGKYSIDEGKEGPYLRKMVLNGARSALRKRRVRRAHTPEPPGLVAAAEETGVAGTERHRILTEVRKLPQKQAAVIILRYYLDYSEAQIADTLGMAKGSVKSHSHRGLAKLQKSLGPEPIKVGGQTNG